MKKATPPPRKSVKIGVLIAEFIGTFSLAYAVLASINGSFAPSIPTGVIAGFTLLLAALSIGGISGAHINPAVTIGLFSIRKISLRNTVYYLIAQFLGAVAALGLVTLVLHGHAGGVKSDTANWTVFSSEMIGAVIFTFGVAAAVEQGLQKISGAVLVGGSLTLGILFASIASNGVVNPAVSIAINSSTWAYLFGPIAGAVIGMNLQHYMRKSS
jgi:glycerol uptake facilitator-like aquaporin